MSSRKNTKPAEPVQAPGQAAGPLLTDEHKAMLRASSADQMADLEASNAAATYATRNLGRETATVGALLSEPIVLELAPKVCTTCGSAVEPGATCAVDGQVST